MHSLPPHTLQVALFGEVLADVFPDRSILGGAPFNVARHLHAFGLQPWLISRIGRDTLADLLTEDMHRRGMTTAGLQRDPHRQTGVVHITLDEAGHRFEILPGQAYDAIDAEETARIMADAQPQMAYFGTLALRETASRSAAERFLQSCRCPAFLDINLRTPWYDSAILHMALDAADSVKLNDQELDEVAQLLGLHETMPEDRARTLQQTFALQRVIVTCGENGAWLLDETGRVIRAPSPVVAPMADTVGAGDAFAAVMMLGQLQSWDVEIALQRACKYAAAQCEVRGAEPAADVHGRFGWLR